LSLHHALSVSFFFHAPATTAIYTLPYTTLFRSFAQAVEQVGRRRVGEIACLVVGKHLVPSPIGAREFRRLRRLARLFNNKTGYRSEEHTSELQSRSDLVCRLLLEKKKKT